MGESAALTTPAGRPDVGPAGVTGGPIVILTYAHSGAGGLAQVLAASPELACTQRTGLLPFCHAALSTWRNVENRAATPSALAIKSVRAMVASMAMIIQSRSGGKRWCETAVAGTAAAETFLQIFPDAMFVCMHRGLRGVLAEGLRAYPWGLDGSPFWPHAGGHPGNNIATIAAYWAASAGPLLEFEEAHPQSCLRVRHEDLTADPQGCAAGLFTSLGLDPGDLALASQHADGAWAEQETEPGSGPVRGLDPQLPIAAQTPPQLLARVRNLHASLGYPLP